MTDLLIEAVVVGVLLVFITIVVLVTVFNHPYELDKIAISLFMSGALFHLLCEIVGINKWYCTNGHACRT